jgi:hypothetical protein
MKLEISQPHGTPHEVEIPHGEVVIGRDPSCNLVLNDDRCSRRHAIIEATPGGLSVRDAGSANGIYVNGRRMERSPLQPGDTVRLGATILTVMDDVAETLVVPEGLELDSPPGDGSSERALRKPARRSTGPRRRPPVVRPAPVPRLPDDGLPLTLTSLAILWGLLAPAALAGGIVVAARSEEPLAGVIAVGVGLLLAAVGVLMALGLRAKAEWARHLQIAAAGLGLFICPVTFASITVLIYMFRQDVSATFEGRGSGAGAAEPTFALSLLGMLALGLVLTAGALLLYAGR